MEQTLCEIFYYLKDLGGNRFYTSKIFFCENTDCSITVERFSDQLQFIFIPTKPTEEMIKHLTAESEFIENIKHFLHEFGFKDLLFRLCIKTNNFYEGQLFPGFIRCELFTTYGLVYTKVRVVVEGCGDYTIKIDLMSNWTLREVSNYLASNERVKGFHCANSFAKNYGHATTDESIENDATLISEIYSKKLQLSLFQGDFGTVLM